MRRKRWRERELHGFKKEKTKESRRLKKKNLNGNIKLQR
jgi:hypothetical protein